MDNYPMYARIIYQVTALVGLAIMSGMIGSRVKTLRYNNLRRPNILHVLIFAIYATGMVFIFSTNFMLTGWTLTQDNLCLAGIYLCVTCYVVEKTLIYLFLLLRVHICREDGNGRVIPYRKDWITIGGLVWILSCVAICSVFAFRYPIHIVSSKGVCTIGLPPTIIIALIVLEVHLNVGLTFLTWYITQRLLQPGSDLTFKLTFHALPFRSPAPLVESLVGIPPAQFSTPTKEGDKRLVMAKAIWGTIGIMIPTIGNLGALLAFKGHEQGWMCMSCCIGDSESPHIPKNSAYLMEPES
ncbi:MAG: hypothetical protein Q9181_000055 [Wetmoreana brouardii]